MMANHNVGSLYVPKSDTIPDALTVDDDNNISDLLSLEDISASLSSEAISEILTDTAQECTHIHPRDIIIAIFLCSNDFLRQYIATKLAFCQLAVILLLPDPGSNRIIFPLWTLRNITHFWRVGETLQGGLIANSVSHFVAFMRIGSSPDSSSSVASISKSDVLNHVIGCGHDTFFSNASDGSTRKRILIDGLAELSWYLPSGSSEDVFSDVTTFINLRGDATSHTNQMNFVTGIASIIVLFATEDGITKSMQEITKLTKEPNKYVVCIMLERESKSKQGKQFKTIPAKNKNIKQLGRDIRNIVSAIMSENATKNTLANCKVMASTCDICVDENQNPDCLIAKEIVQNLFKDTENKKVPELKETLLPVQGNLWQKWCKLDKELNRLTQYSASKLEIEAYISKLKDEKSAIRNEQARLINANGRFMNGFVNVLKEHEPKGRYLIYWLKEYLDSRSHKVLPPLRKEYNEVWKLLRNRHSESDGREELERQFIQLHEDIEKSNFGLEHFVREMGQIFEVLQCQYAENATLFDRLPNIAVDILLHGFPIEVMDGDASYVPIEWIKAVLKQLQLTVRDRPILVVAVLGIQSTGKSTLLNTMFGLDFPVAAGRCTRGIFLHLLPVSDTLHEKVEIGFDFVLVLDTEGLGSDASMDGKTKDNELATFVMGLSNITLVNIRGETANHMTNMLQVAVHALVKMKLVRLRSRCMFVHQNVPAADASEANSVQRHALQKELDSLTKLAAQEECVDIKEFNDVVQFDVDEHVFYFPGLWYIDPPMGIPNVAYSNKTQELRNKILQLSTQQKHHHLRLSEFADHIENVWNGVLQQNFVFSFKNSLEISVYSKLEKELKQWTWRLFLFTYEKKQEYQSRLRNDPDEKTLNEIVSDLQVEFAKKHDDIFNHIETYFDKHDNKDIMVNWKHETVTKMLQLKNERIQNVIKELSELKNLYSDHHNLDKLIEQYESQFEKKCEDKVNTLHQSETRLSDVMLELDFQKIWSNFKESDFLCNKKTEIRSSAQHILIKHFQNQQITVINYFKGQTLQQKLSELKKVDDEQWQFFPNPQEQQIGTTHRKDTMQNPLYNIECLITEIQAMVLTLDSYKSQKLSANTGYHDFLLLDILRNLETKHLNFDETSKDMIEMKICLLCMAMETAVLICEEIHTRLYTTYHPLEQFAKQRPKWCSKFKNMYNRISTDIMCADEICDKLREFLLKAVESDSVIEIAQEICKVEPIFSQRKSGIEAQMLRFLAETNNFEEYKSYLKYPNKYYQEWVSKKVNECCFNGHPPLSAKVMGKVFQKYKYHICAGIEIAEKDQHIQAKDWLMCCMKNVAHHSITIGTYDNYSISDMNYFLRYAKGKITNMFSELKHHFTVVSPASLKDWGGKVNDLLGGHFLDACWAVCPFCRAVCERTNSNHTELHIAKHRPHALIGWSFVDNINGVSITSDELATDICTSLVGLPSHAERTFKNQDTLNKTVLFSEYRTVNAEYAKWNMYNRDSHDLYWKWFVCTYKHEIEDLYCKSFHNRGKLPEEWKRITKEDVIKELNKKMS